MVGVLIIYMLDFGRHGALPTHHSVSCCARVAFSRSVSGSLKIVNRMMEKLTRVNLEDEVIRNHSRDNTIQYNTIQSHAKGVQMKIKFLSKLQNTSPTTQPQPKHAVVHFSKTNTPTQKAARVCTI